MAFSLSRKAAGAGFRLAAFDTIGSTSEEALARARGGEAGPLWLVSSEQTAGRGRRGSAWQTARGNLAASLLLTTELPPTTIAQLGFVAGIAVASALDRCCPVRPDLRLKWPNDVLAEDRKLVGILLQTEGLGGGLRAVAIGIGINVRHIPDGVTYPTTSLRALGLAIEAEAVFEALSEAWVETATQWDEGRGFAAIRRTWLARAAGLAGEVAVRLEGEIVRGRFETIDELGQLVLRADDGSVRHVSAGEVHFGAAATARSKKEDGPGAAHAEARP